MNPKRRIAFMVPRGAIWRRVTAHPGVISGVFRKNRFRGSQRMGFLIAQEKACRLRCYSFLKHVANGFVNPQFNDDYLLAILKLQECADRSAQHQIAEEAKIYRIRKCL